MEKRGLYMRTEFFEHRLEWVERYGHLFSPLDLDTIDYTQFLSLRSVGYEGARATEFVQSGWYNQNEVSSKVENARMREVLVEKLDEVWS